MKKALSINSLSLSVDSLGNYHIKMDRIEMLAVPVVHVYETWTSVNWTIVTNTGVRVSDTWGLDKDTTEDPTIIFMYDLAKNAYRINNPEKKAEEVVQEEVEAE